jgi:pycsar effector protein
MNDDERVDAAWNQLNVILSFFPRIDAKLSVVLGLNLGMLAVFFSQFPAISAVTAMQLACASLFVIAVVVSLFHLYQGSFPHLKGGTSSLVYFRRIASLPESEFLSACKKRSLPELTDDLYEQVWRNSKILTCKFEALQRAHVGLLCASVPWAITLLITAPK